MKKITTLLAALAVAFTYGQGLETFDDSNLTATYADGSFIGNDGIEWTYVHSRDEETSEIDGNGIMLRRGDEPSSISATIDGGIGSFSVDTRKAFTGSSERYLELEINGTVVGSFGPEYDYTGEDGTIITWDVEDINVEGEFDMVIRIPAEHTGNRQIVLDNISWTEFEAAPACEAPTDVTMDEVLETSASFSWTEPADAENTVEFYQWQIFDDPDAEEPYDFGNVPQGTAMATVEDLVPDTEYLLIVLSVCDSENEIVEVSDPIVFTTEALGLEDNVIEGFSFYPNPAVDQLQLEAAGTIESAKFFNVLGQEVLAEQVGATNATVQVSTLAKGVYFMQVTVDGQTAVYRVLKQ